jgi:prostaglandin-E synthase
VLPLSIQILLTKKEDDGEFWTRLLKDKGLEKTNVTVDWDRYVDEDEENFSFNTDSLEGGIDFSKEDISVI